MGQPPPGLSTSMESVREACAKQAGTRRALSNIGCRSAIPSERSAEEPPRALLAAKLCALEVLEVQARARA